MATGDKKRAVMTDDINNSGSSYPVMPLKTIDQTPTAGNTDHLISSAGVKSAIDDVGGLNQSLEIASGTDLNNLTTPGAYNCANSTIASTLVNSPVSTIGFSLLVAKRGNSAPEQLIIADSKLFSRVKNSGGWTDWTSHGETTYLGNVFRSTKYAATPNGTLTIDLAQRTKNSLTGFLVLVRYVSPYTVSLYYVIASGSSLSRYVTISDPSNYSPTIAYDSTANTLTVNFASNLTSMQADIYYDS